MTLAARFEEFATWCERTSPLYRRFAEAVAADDDLLALAGEVPDDRSPPHVLLASVHYLLLDRPDHRLADFYASVTDDPLDAADTDSVRAFRAFCADYRDELVPLLRERRTQTNSVRRCSALYPAFASLAAHEGESLTVVEVGSSAGLNLLWDRYGYDYGDAGRTGRLDSGALVESAVREGDPPLPADPAPVDERLGVDLHPLDVRDPEDVRWLLALTWPEHEERRALLRDAVSVAAEDPPEVLAGDALDLLPEILADRPEPVVVYNTQTLYQFDEDDREQFRRLVAEAGTGRRLHWLSGERGVEGDDPEIWLEWTTVDQGSMRTRELLAYEQHGRWIRWNGG